MVFPSRGCQTCRKRRVKCDTVRPTCGRCVKASRICAWDPNVQAGQEGLLFKSENAFAQGQPRRPREVKKPVTDSPIIVEQATFSSPFETLAFHYWVENFVFRLDELPDFGHEYLEYVLLYWNRTPPASSLHLALSALSLAVFGKARHMSQAIEDAETIHAQTIESAKRDMDGVSNENIDQLLLTIMLMGFYENIMFHHKEAGMEDSPGTDDVGSQFWKDVCHHKGASGLLKVRWEPGYAPNLPLDRAVRRQLIRTIILRGVTVPDWIVDGVDYGEESPVLDLDALMVRVANLRARSLRILSGLDTGGAIDPHQLKIVAGDADELNIALATWAQSVPEDWNFSTQHFPPTPQSSESPGNDQLYEGTSLVYASHAHAAIWNRYRAVRLIVNSICIRSLSELLLIAEKLSHCDSGMESRFQLVTSQQNKCRDNIELLATDLCGSVPCFFNSPGANGVGMRATAETEIPPKVAILMVWPVAIAIRTQGIPDPQRTWLKRRLKIAAESLGDAMLETVIQNDEFRF